MRLKFPTSGWMAIFIFSLFWTTQTTAQNVQASDSLIHAITRLKVNAASEGYAKKIQDSIQKIVKDSLTWNHLNSIVQYPLIKNSKWSGVFPVPGIREKPDVQMKYKLLFNMTLWSKDSASHSEINEGFAEIGRIINLHIASGIPKENLEFAIVVHGSALNAYLNNDHYFKKFKTNNPNLDLLSQFTALNGKLLACGQAELFFHISADDMISDVRTAYSAQVVLSTYQLKGFVLYNIHEDK